MSKYERAIQYHYDAYMFQFYPLQLSNFAYTTLFDQFTAIIAHSNQYCLFSWFCDCLIVFEIYLNIY